MLKNLSSGTRYEIAIKSTPPNCINEKSTFVEVMVIYIYRLTRATTKSDTEQQSNARPKHNFTENDWVPLFSCQTSQNIIYIYVYVFIHIYVIYMHMNIYVVARTKTLYIHTCLLYMYKHHADQTIILYNRGILSNIMLIMTWELNKFWIYYRDVTRTLRRLKSPATELFVQHIVRHNTKENIKAPLCCSIVRVIHRWSFVALTKDQ